MGRSVFDALLFFAAPMALSATSENPDWPEGVYAAIGLVFFLLLIGLAVYGVASTIKSIRLKTSQNEYQREKAELAKQYQEQPFHSGDAEGSGSVPAYDQKLLSRLASAREQAKISWGVTIFMAAVAFIFGLFSGLIVAVIVVVAVLIVILRHREKEYIVLYKERVVRKELSRYFQKLQYIPFAGIHPGKVKNSGLIKIGRTFFSEDYIKGTHHGVDFEQAEVNTYTKGNKSKVTYFNGRWIVLKLEKSIDSALCVYDKAFPFYKQAPSMSYKLQEVEMEDVAFNEKYKVITYNAHSAFYMLTPQIISNLTKITAYMSKEGSMPLAFFIFKNEVHIAVHNAKNAFEITAKEPLDIGYMQQKIANEVQLITDVINIFNAFF